MSFIVNSPFEKDKSMSRVISRAGSKTRPNIRCARRFVMSELLHIWTRLLACSPKSCGTCHYRRISGRDILTVDPDGNNAVNNGGCNNNIREIEAPDLVLKVCLLGDSQIGKTTFINAYMGIEGESKGVQCKGVNLMDKNLQVRGAKMSFNIWDVQGDRFQKHVPKMCADAVAIIIMFDLTSRQTLNNVIDWYRRARKLNPMALPILVGTKFDEFTQLPFEMQRMIIRQARAYAKAMNATLFFSSVKHNINVNKIFKYITAKVFNLPWNLERNLTMGEPTIDF